ncbi:MAG: hypothetical protein JW896_07000, partial [Deltaproteobacteria bacterium]|nr:hypothetical protein [Deltaproteobacteria bacterium]
MTAFRIWVIALTCLVIGLTGCAKEYRYIPPTSEAGLQCVTKCLAVKDACRDRVLESARVVQQECERQSAEEYLECKIRAEEEYSQCQDKAKEEYYACLKYASDRSLCEGKKCEEERCYKRT